MHHSRMRRRALPLLLAVALPAFIALLLAGNLGLTVARAASAPTPTSCAVIHANDPSAPDGNYALLLDGHILPIYCFNMATAPTDYLTVPQGPGQNFSLLVGTGPLTTTFQRVRLDPATLQVTVDDFTFATSSGGPISFAGSPTNISDYSYATASDCVSRFVPEGRANVDLVGTPLAIVNNFATVGTPGLGSATLSSNDQVANLTGGGLCGGTGPGGNIAGVHGNAAGPLQLKWITSAVVGIAQCQNNGWQSFGGLFKNQGDCVSFVATNGKNAPG